MMHHQLNQDFVDAVHAKTWKSWGRAEKRGVLCMEGSVEVLAIGGSRAYDYPG